MKTQHILCMLPCEQNIGSADGATEVSTPPSGSHLTFAAAALLLVSSSLPHWLSPRPSGAGRRNAKCQFKTISRRDFTTSYHCEMHCKSMYSIFPFDGEKATNCTEWRHCWHSGKYCLKQIKSFPTGIMTLFGIGPMCSAGVFNVINLDNKDWIPDLLGLEMPNQSSSYQVATLYSLQPGMFFIENLIKHNENNG